MLGRGCQNSSLELSIDWDDELDDEDDESDDDDEEEEELDDDEDELDEEEELDEDLGFFSPFCSPDSEDEDEEDEDDDDEDDEEELSWLRVFFFCSSFSFLSSSDWCCLALSFCANERRLRFFFSRASTPPAALASSAAFRLASFLAFFAACLACFSAFCSLATLAVFSAEVDSFEDDEPASLLDEDEDDDEELDPDSDDELELDDDEEEEEEEDDDELLELLELAFMARAGFPSAEGSEYV